jgi:hypothetical protein
MSNATVEIAQTESIQEPGVRRQEEGRNNGIVEGWKNGEKEKASK